MGATARQLSATIANVTRKANMSRDQSNQGGAWVLVLMFGCGGSPSAIEVTPVEPQQPVALAKPAGSALTKGPLQGVKSVSAGLGHTCALLNSGKLVCWGENGVGQAGVSPSEGGVVRPHVVQGPANVTEVHAGAFHTCAREAEGVVWCWGSLARGTTNNTVSRVLPPSPENALAGSARPVFTTTGALTGARSLGLSLARPLACAATVDEVLCWPTRDPMLGPVDATRERWPGVVQVAIGDNYLCALVILEGKSKVQCRRSADAPTDVKLPAGFVPVEVSAGTLHLCIRSESRELRCYRQGIGENWWEKPPTKITGAGDVVDVGAGGDFVCATNTVGEVSCFLAEPEGLDEETTRTAWAAPREQARIIAGVRGVQVAAGGALNAFGHGHACAVSAEQRVFCWGDGESGQLGRSELVTSAGPAEVSIP